MPSWRVERPLAALAVTGDVVLDLRGAEVPQGDVDVQLTGIAVMGDKKVAVRAWLTRDERDRRAIK